MPPIRAIESYTYTIFIPLICFSVKIVYSFYISNKKLLKFLSISVFYGMSAVFGVKSGFQGMKMGLFSN